MGRTVNQSFICNIISRLCRFFLSFRMMSLSTFGKNFREKVFTLQRERFVFFHREGKQANRR